MILCGSPSKGPNPKTIPKPKGTKLEGLGRVRVIRVWGLVDFGAAEAYNYRLPLDMLQGLCWVAFQELKLNFHNIGI